MILRIRQRRFPLRDKSLGLRDLFRPVAGLQLGIVGLRLIELRAHLGERVLEIDFFERRQHLAGAHAVALIDIQDSRCGPQP